MISKKSTINKLIALGVLTALFAILTVLTTNVAVCEFFATTFSRAWIALFGRIFSILPFTRVRVVFDCRDSFGGNFCGVFACFFWSKGSGTDLFLCFLLRE